MSDILTLTNENFDEQVLRSDRPVIVDYWAPWCGPCRMIGPVIEQIAAERAWTVKVGKVNVDEQPQLAERAGVQGIPLVVLYRDGQPTAHASAPNPSALSNRRSESTNPRTTPHSAHFGLLSAAR